MNTANFDKANDEVHEYFVEDEDPMVEKMEQVNKLHDVPNPLVETYLETRLEENAAKKSDKEKEEALQLIMLLRKAYLKQLLTSLKTEEVQSSTEKPNNSRESKSLEEAQSRIDLMRAILGKTKDSLTFSDATEKSSETDNPAISPRNKNSVESIPLPLTDKKQSEEREKEIVSVTSAPFVVPNPEEMEKNVPAFWQKVDSSILKDEGDPFSIRVKREARRRYQQQSAYNGNYYHQQYQGYAPYYDSEEEIETVTPISTTSTTTTPTTTSTTEAPKKISDEEAQKQIDAFADDLKKFFTLLSVLDQDQCLQKLVCDVHTEPDQDLSKFTQYEANIITTFK